MGPQKAGDSNKGGLTNRSWLKGRETHSVRLIREGLLGTQCVHTHCEGVIYLVPYTGGADGCVGRWIMEGCVGGGIVHA